MLRTELLEKLERVAPALSGNNLVPILSHFWFRDNMLLAYNDQIAISTGLASDFEGAIPDTLISLLSVSKAKEVSFLVGKDAEGKVLPEGQLLVKAASSRLKLPFLDVQSTEIFEMPELTAKASLPVDLSEFIEALDCCTRSLKEDTSMPDSLGITLSYKDKGIDLYATNDATISYARVKTKTELESFRVVISGAFCRQMLSLAKSSGNKHFEINSEEGYSLFQCGSNTLFGRLVDVPRPLDFDGVIASQFPKKAQSGLAPVPSKLELILDRAVIITESKADRPRTEIVLKDGIAKFHSQSEKGEVKDQMQVAENHPNVELAIDPRLFKNGYGYFTEFLLTPHCLIMSKGTSLYLVSAAH